MLFPTVQFAIFFPIVLALSWALMSRPRLWKPFIVLASYVFYAAASWRFCILLAGITLGNHAAARLIERTDEEHRRKLIVGVTVALDLGVLAMFKYYGFFVRAWRTGSTTSALGLPLPMLAIALPVGISFFTFQAISYVVDVKRRVVRPSSLVDVAVYLSFFPHLVAGPIVRAKEFLPQLEAPRDPSRVAVGSGIALIGLGLVKKVVIADYLARTVVDPVFAVPQAYSAPDVWLAAYAYTAQIYCDFSGYTDMAIGLALLMGYVFPQNFRSPYRATGFRDFWRRWHMTLSRFLRDFLYIPLGGNRGGRAEDLPQSDHHDGARRALARGSVDVRALGRVPRRRPGRRARPRGPACAAGVAALARDLPPDRLRVGPVPSQSVDLAGSFLSRLTVPGDATLWRRRSCSRSSS